MNRKARRLEDKRVQERRQQFAAGSGSIIGSNGGTAGKGSSGGWGNGNLKQTPASGQQPAVNPFLLPKTAGLNVTSQVYPSYYYVEWDMSSWRAACDQAVNMGYPLSYATLSVWTFQKSAFVQSLFTKIANKLRKISFSFMDAKGNQVLTLTDELCNQLWTQELRKEMALAFFWGFSGLNFDPVNGKVYKYPMQQIDPINRMLRASTFSFYDGERFSDADNLLFVQPSTSQESFLGWMQPITAAFIQMNLASNNWLAAGRRLAFPLMTIGYPQNDGGIDPTTNTAINPYKNQAELIAQNIDPSVATVYPYTLDQNGNIVKSIEVGFENPGAGANMHKVYQEFNQEQKNDIMTMILGGTLSNGTAKNGNRALGEVHERELDDVIEAVVQFVVAELNGEFLQKIKKYYKNFPEGKFYANLTKQLTVEEIAGLSNVVNQNGKRLTDQFFIENGLNREYFEDGPVVEPKPGDNEDEDPEVMMATPSKPLKQLLKKKYL